MGFINFGKLKNNNLFNQKITKQLNNCISKVSNGDHCEMRIYCGTKENLDFVIEKLNYYLHLWLTDKSNVQMMWQTDFCNRNYLYCWATCIYKKDMDEPSKDRFLDWFNRENNIKKITVESNSPGIIIF